MSYDVYADSGLVFSDAPHEATDGQKVESLVAAYESGAPVTPVVFVEYPDYPSRAVTGSHRLAAMAKVFASIEEATEAGYVLSIDTSDEIETILSERGEDYEMIAHLLRQLPLDPRVLSALEDQ